MNIYIRFSEDIDADIERGYSFYFRTKEKMDGLCAWTTPFFMVDGDVKNFDGCDATEDDIRDYANKILNNSYGSYSDNSLVHVITGACVGQGNDGVLITEVSLVNTIKI